MSLAAFLAAGCATVSGGSGGKVTIPTGDSSYPIVHLDVVPTGGSLTTVTAHSLPILLHAASNHSLAFVALAIDDDGGVQNVQIWETVKQCKNSGNLTTCSGPGLAGAPQVENPDKGKAPGQLADTHRIVRLTVDMHPLTAGFDFVELRIWAAGSNFSNLSDRTQDITVQYP